MKQFRNRVVIALALSFVVHTVVAAQTDPEELLQSGVYKEEVEGELEGAIKIFEKIIAEYPQNRPVAAQALLHLGSSYEKLGNLKAEDAYQRLIEEFGDQHSMVSEARMRLQKMRIRELTEGMQERGAGPTYRIALDEDAPQIRPSRQYDFSPNGEQIVYQGKDGIYVSDATGTLRRQLVAQGDGPNDWFVVFPKVGQARWSPDGKQIAYFAGNRRPPGDDPNDLIWTIFVIDAEGGAPRQLVDHLDPEPYGGLCWTPDGKGLTYLALEGAKTMDLNGKIVSRVALERNSASTRLTGYSPDGRWFALTLKADLMSGNNYDTDVYIVPTSGGEVVQLTFIHGFDGMPVWGSDSRSVYFISSRGGEDVNSNIWKLRVDPQTGERLGEPEQVTFFTDAQIVHPQVVSDGDRIAFTLEKKKHTIHVAPDGKPEEYRSLARGVYPQISPDGKTVYYVGEGPDQQGIFAISSNGGKPERLTTTMPHINLSDLSPDGESLTYFASLNDERGLYVLPLSGGDPRLLATTGCDECCTAPRWSPDGKSIAYIYTDGLFLVSKSDGQPKLLATLYNWEAWTLTWSPDGQYIAALGYPEQGNNAVYIVPTAGGEPRLISDLNDYKEGLEWHPDGKSLTYHLSKSKSQTYRAWLDDRPPELFLDKSDAWDYTGCWSPDGKLYYLLSFKDSKAFVDAYDINTEEFTPFGEDAGLPIWSGDHKTIVWTTEKSIRQLWLMEDYK